MPNVIYLIIPLIFYPLSAVLLSKYARDIGARKIAFYRQLTMFLWGIPFLPFIISYKDIYILEWKNILLASFFGALYVIFVFFASNLLPFMVAKIFFEPSRTIVAFIIAYFLFSETFSFIDIIGIIFIFIGFFIFSFSKIDVSHLKLKNISLGIFISLFNGIVFSFSGYFFKLYGAKFPPLLASYTLETINGVFIFLFLLFFSFFEKKNNFLIEKKYFLLIFLLAPLTLIATYGFAESYKKFPFYIVSVTFIAGFVVVGLFSYLFLKEKLDKIQILASFIILSSLAGIILF
ncbi:EamA family transporter [Candidatus Gracilibacteria bacterium]|nr:EamA family transporter [Candidatus Gracilibacteria bacterium]NUJ99070.1 EamA family transporter [Candidatus Gracilibacteria bacterium]